mmetsp:Transcript_25330/g.63542  ORF Transcript_25330/g.63542 Transcript_25330/m.63542 type:complete len:342 (-) Transcript_25330:71-1096(-)
MAGMDFVALPKAELHCHLNGCVRDDTLADLARGSEELERLAHAAIRGERDLAQIFGVFSLIHQLVRTEQALRRITREAVEDMYEDGVWYAEIRTTPKRVGSGDIDEERYVQIVADEVEKTQTRLNQGGSHPIFVCLLLSINREMSEKEAMNVVKLATRYSDKVVGIDVSGNPSKGAFQTFMPALTQARREGLKITIHCGEVRNDNEVNEIIKFKPERIGHFCCRTSEMEEEVERAGIVVELCPTSNLLTNSVDSFDTHHFHDLIRSGMKLCVCTDDPGVFRCKLSGELEGLLKSGAGEEKDKQHSILSCIRGAFDAAFSLPVRLHAEARGKLDKMTSHLQV